MSTIVGVRTILVCVAVFLGLMVTPARGKPPTSWPPVSGPGTLFAHYGEEHWDDEDGARILPVVVADTVRYRPGAVVMSADKSSDGTVENLRTWKDFMRPYDRAGIPYFAAVGNHDRKAPPGFPGGIFPAGDLANYERVFADRPYPFGDAPPPSDPLFSPRERPGDDPAGASSHYSFDYGRTRWIVIDNSCFSIVTCDALQNPPFPDPEGHASQYEFLRTRAAEAKARGMRVFVNMHMPTQDDRPGHTQPTPSAHTMGEGISPDNALFEQVASEEGVDAVFAGHIKGQWKYRAQGVRYFTDGGAGGEVYVGPGEEVGVDSGYWHGYRLVRVTKDGLVTDAVPVFVPGGISITGPAQAAPGDELTFAATGRQPTEHGPAVDALELREPDPSRPNASKLVSPARIWTSSNPEKVLAPLAAPGGDDPRRDASRQTTSGRFRALCPGKATVTITSGFERASHVVAVPSAPGEIVRSIAPGETVFPPGPEQPVAVVDLAQPAVVRAVLLRGDEVVAELASGCRRSTGARAVVWDGLIGGREAPEGPYTVEVTVLSDRAPVIRRFTVFARD